MESPKPSKVKPVLGDVSGLLSTLVFSPATNLPTSSVFSSPDAGTPKRKPPFTAALSTNHGENDPTNPQVLTQSPSISGDNKIINPERGGIRIPPGVSAPSPAPTPSFLELLAAGSSQLRRLASLAPPCPCLLLLPDWPGRSPAPRRRPGRRPHRWVPGCQPPPNKPPIACPRRRPHPERSARVDFPSTPVRIALSSSPLRPPPLRPPALLLCEVQIHWDSEARLLLLVRKQLDGSFRGLVLFYSSVYLPRAVKSGSSLAGWTAICLLRGGEAQQDCSPEFFGDRLIPRGRRQ